MFRPDEEQAIGKSRVGEELGDMNGLLSGEETVNAHRRNTTCYEHRRIWETVNAQKQTQ